MFAWVRKLLEMVCWLKLLHPRYGRSATPADCACPAIEVPKRMIKVRIVAGRVLCLQDLRLENWKICCAVRRASLPRKGWLIIIASHNCFKRDIKLRFIPWASARP